MLKHLFVACLILVLNQSCYSQQPDSTNLVGKWIVKSEQRSFKKNGKTVETFAPENIPSEEAYVYNFQSDSLVTVTNLQNEFSWDFKIAHTDTVLMLVNIHHDAEDDELHYEIKKGRLILTRKMEDADPNDDTAVITVCTRMILNKL